MLCPEDRSSLLELCGRPHLHASEAGNCSWLGVLARGNVLVDLSCFVAAERIEVVGSTRHSAGDSSVDPAERILRAARRLIPDELRSLECLEPETTRNRKPLTPFHSLDEADRLEYVVGI